MKIAVRIKIRIRTRVRLFEADHQDRLMSTYLDGACDAVLSTKRSKSKGHGRLQLLLREYHLHTHTAMRDTKTNELGRWTDMLVKGPRPHVTSRRCPRETWRDT